MVKLLISMMGLSMSSKKVNRKKFNLENIKNRSFKAIYLAIFALSVSIAVHYWEMLTGGMDDKGFIIYSGIQSIVIVIVFFFAQFSQKKIKQLKEQAEYNAYHDSLAGSPNRTEIERGLYKALINKEIMVYYQPQIDIKSGEIVGIEALLRWKHPTLGMVPPDVFIPFAERSGLIVPIGEWVLKTACEQNKVWQKNGFPSLRVSVNISEQQIIREDFIETVNRILKETSLEPEYLELEVTERVIQNTERITSVLSKLKETGIRIAIDDFGVGYSSLNHLKNFHIDTIKVDKSFVQDIFIDPKNEAITTTIIELGHNLKLDVIAEGVETKEQFEFLEKQRCDKVQGYMFSCPVPPEDIDKLLVAHCKKEATAPVKK